MKTAQVRPYYVKKAFTFVGAHYYPGDVFSKTENECSPYKLGMLISNHYLDGYRTVSQEDMDYLISGQPSKSKAAPAPKAELPQEQAPVESEVDDTEPDDDADEVTPTATPRRRRR